jgi:hypothetical protein
MDWRGEHSGFIKKSPSWLRGDLIIKVLLLSGQSSAHSAVDFTTFLSILPPFIHSLINTLAEDCALFLAIS